MSDDWKPGCEPRWFKTNDLRQYWVGSQLYLQQKAILQGYGEWPPRAEEWRDVPIIEGPLT